MLQQGLMNRAWWVNQAVCTGQKTKGGHCFEGGMLAKWKTGSIHNPATGHCSVTIWVQLTGAVNKYSGLCRSLYTREQEVSLISSVSSVSSLRYGFDILQSSFPGSCWICCVRGFYSNRPSESKSSSSGLRLQGLPRASPQSWGWQSSLLQQVCCCWCVMSPGHGVMGGSKQAA